MQATLVHRRARRRKRNRKLSGNTTSEDPWGTPFAIECGESEPRVVSAGRDKQLNTEDDIS